MELRDHLQTALGATYALDGELGGGGMSRVFAATETAFGRKVVIKVLATELAAGVNVDRFKREIQLAANLQHPHIVPVLTAGEMDGTPYYTMPFIDGESLRRRLARGPLPVAEAVSVLRDVARALAYAHEHGVVHRDIKPDNVLLAGGSATVADFGIAKALAAAKGAHPSQIDAETSALTSLGVSIGTPIYMAPEQAAADPSTDHRADIYSFGCMAYELLAGRPPFSGLSPHKLLAAHMGERPKPLSELRPDVPPVLADIVMQCLAKDPDARPQRAADLARLLDAVSSSASNEAMPAIAFSGPGALKRALTIYVVAFAAVVILAKAAAVGIGVPDWVMPTVVVIMLLGLPAILLTAYVQRVARRAITTTPGRGADGSTEPPSTIATIALKASPYVSWRHVGGTLASAVGAFALLVTLLMALRPLGLGPLKSLMASGALARRDKILVADFTSTGAGADTSLGGVISEAVRADLGQSPVVSVVTPQTVAAVLQRMQRAPDTRIDTSLAREVAKREGVKAVVGGDVHTLPGGGFVITMKLVSADSGKELASLTASADGAKDLIPTIGNLTRKLRARMGESLKHVQTTAQLAQVTTSSLPALQKYTEAQRAMSIDLDYTKAEGLFREATQIDTAFAAAYRALATVMGNAGRDRDGQIKALEKAYAHVDRLPEVERYQTIASYWTNGPRPDPEKAKQAYESLLVIRPNFYAALNNIALIYANERDFTKAERYLREAIAANPSSPLPYGNLMGYLAEQGKTVAAESIFTEQLKISSNNPRVALGRVNMLFARGQYDSANAVVDSLSRANRGAADLERQDVGVHAMTAMVRGKLNESLRLVSVNAQASQKDGDPSALLTATFDSAFVEAWYRGSKDKAVRLLEAGLQRTPLTSLPPLTRPYVGLAQIYALAGRPDLAKKMLTDFETTAPTMSAQDAASNRHSIQFAIALAEGRYPDAVREAKAADVGACTVCATPVIALAYDYAQQNDSAITYYTRYVGSPSILNRFETDGFFLAGSYKRLGELWEAKGDRAKAVAYYTKFVDLWKNADADLQPKVAEVKKRLTRLEAEGR